jgi:uncharacterized membrane protein YGL010W
MGFFLFFFFQCDYILLVLHFVKEAGIVLCGNNRDVDLHQISMPILLLFLMVLCGNNRDVDLHQISMPILLLFLIVLCGNNRDVDLHQISMPIFLFVPDDVMFLKTVMTESKGRCHDEFVF